MENEYNKGVCEEKHKNLDGALTRIFKKFKEHGLEMNQLTKKMDKFQLMAIAALLAMLLNIVKDFIIK